MEIWAFTVVGLDSVPSLSRSALHLVRGRERRFVPGAAARVGLHQARCARTVAGEPAAERVAGQAAHVCVRSPAEHRRNWGGAPDVRVTNRVLYVRPWMPCVRSCSTIQVWNSLCSLDRPRVVRPPDCEKSHTAFVDCKAAAILEYLDFRPAEALAVRGVLSAAARGR